VESAKGCDRSSSSGEPGVTRYDEEGCSQTEAVATIERILAILAKA